MCPWTLAAYKNSIVLNLVVSKFLEKLSNALQIISMVARDLNVPKYFETCERSIRQFSNLLQSNVRMILQ